jgi:hypothetical protein
MNNVFVYYPLEGTSLYKLVRIKHCIKGEFWWEQLYILIQHVYIVLVEW